MIRIRPLLVLAMVLMAACGGGSAQPHPSQRYSAPLPAAADLATSAVLFLDTNETATGIEYVSLDIRGLNCAAGSAELSQYVHLVDAPLVGGQFSIEDPGIGTITGRFETPDRARGQVVLRYDLDQGGALSNFTIRDPNALCDLGTLDWVAEAQS